MIAAGEKVIENRTWPTSYRGPLAIHAGKSKDWLESDDMAERPDMVFGAVVASARIVACLRIDYATWPEPWAHLRNNHHANGPWCWILEDVTRLDRPIPCRGAQGLWDVPADAQKDIER